MPSRLALSTACPLQQQQRRQRRQGGGFMSVGAGWGGVEHWHARASTAVACRRKLHAPAHQLAHLDTNCTAVMGAVCSEKVTKQKPLDSVHTLTCDRAGWAQLYR